LRETELPGAADADAKLREGPWAKANPPESNVAKRVTT